MLSALPEQIYMAALAELAAREREVRAAECEAATRVEMPSESAAELRDRAARIRMGEL